MMLRIITFSLFLGASAGAACAADPIYPLGSRLGFVPPPGFVASKNFPGFENPDAKSMMMMAALPAQAYPDMEKAISAEALKAQGVTEEKRENLALPNNAKGVLVVGTDTDKERGKIRKWMLIEQLPEGVALVSVVVPEPAFKTITDDMVRTSLKTLAVRASIPMEEQLQLVPFKLNDMSGLHAVRVMGNNGVILTYGDKPTALPTDQPFFAVQIGPAPTDQNVDRDNFARSLFTSPGDVKELHVVSGELLKLGAGGSQLTHELQAEALDAFTNTPMKLVQWVRFGNGSVIRMLGIARADQWQTAFTHFRAVRDGIGPHE